ncbi:hypothetical protein DIPPA_25980 [Diplonema papillatum]|nr:hypothetical protein DIPPA_25979 [Diplonema papillatum]KAJ9445859.1 hypothetical protein DIPPA_25980 [Diplonema papillatum]
MEGHGDRVKGTRRRSSRSPPRKKKLSKGAQIMLLKELKFEDKIEKNSQSTKDISLPGEGHPETLNPRIFKRTLSLE